MCLRQSLCYSGWVVDFCGRKGWRWGSLEYDFIYITDFYKWSYFYHPLNHGFPDFFLLLFQKLDTENKIVRQVAAHMVSHINKKVDSLGGLCSELSLKRILSAVHVIPNEKVMRCELPRIWYWSLPMSLSWVILWLKVLVWRDVFVCECVGVCVWLAFSPSYYLFFISGVAVWA